MIKSPPPNFIKSAAKIFNQFFFMSVCIFIKKSKGVPTLPCQGPFLTLFWKLTIFADFSKEASRSPREYFEKIYFKNCGQELEKYIHQFWRQHNKTTMKMTKILKKPGVYVKLSWNLILISKIPASTYSYQL